MLLTHQLALHNELVARIRQDEVALKYLMSKTPSSPTCSLPGMGPILAAVVVAEIDDISRALLSAQKLCGYSGLCPATSSSGGKTYHGRLLPQCNKWLRWAFVRPPG